MRRYIPPPKVPRNSHLRYFSLLTPTEQAQAVRRLLASHQSEHHVAELTGLSVEGVRRIMANP